MSNQGKTVTRAELYTAVWSKPLNRLAKEWNTTYAQIVLACQEMEVPRPGQEYWPNLTLGREIDKNPLPATACNVPMTCELLPAGARKKRQPIERRTAPGTPISTAIQLPEEKKENIENQNREERNRPSLVSNVHQMHPRIQSLYTEMKHARIIDHGPVEIKEEGNFDVWVSKNQMERALIILNGIVSGLEAQGAKFEVASRFHKHLVAQFPEGQVEFHLHERMKGESVVVRKEPMGTGYFNHFGWRYTPSGKLSFRITDYWPDGTRKNWNDGVHQRLEDKIPDIIDQICANPKIAKEQREERERVQQEEQRKWHEAYLRRSAPERLAKMTEELKKTFEIQEGRWERAQNAGNFLIACEQSMRGANNKPLEGWQEQWLAWGRDWIKSINPLTNGHLEKLKLEFDELRELRAFVERLKIESPELFVKKSQVDQ